LITLFFHWLKSNRTLLTNTTSLVGATAMTGILGAIYWWIAARQFPVRDVGLASADVSAMLFLGTLCVLGQGTLLIGEIPRHPGREAALLSTALLVSGGTGAISGVLFAFIAPLASADFMHLRASVSSIALFSLGVSATTITIVLDDALVGLLRGDLQFWRNSIFAITKLVLLCLAGTWLLYRSNAAISLAWINGILISLLPLLLYCIRKRIWQKQRLRPDWALLHKLGGTAIQHHMLNLILQAPTMAMPILVTILLSALTNASFYVAWMIASFVFTGTSALTMVLYAINPEQRAELIRKIRLTLGLSLLVCLLGCLFFQIEAIPILTFFGANYVQGAASCLRIIILGSLPAIIKDHYVALCRMQGTQGHAIVPAAIGSVLELGMATAGAYIGSLHGLSIGWIIALTIEALYMAYPVYQAARPQTHKLHKQREHCHSDSDREHDHLATSLPLERESHV
jgi:Membrane protein involved in the export of O-antigen and teichoic acid